MENRVQTEGRESDAWVLGSVKDVEYVAPKPEPEGAQMWFFTRKGGVSKPPFDSLNISLKVGDDPDAVTENRDRIREVAGDGVVRVSRPGLAGEADALVTDEGGFSLVVAVADCVPVALIGDEAGEVAMVHSGWRGTIAEIVARVVREMDGDGIRAYIGPCIRGCCYEVSEELAERFADRFGRKVVEGRYLHLPRAIKRNLEDVGVAEVHDLGLCTGCRTDLFFSHRKLGPETGRNLAAVARLP
jgi:YfiH family protein